MPQLSFNENNSQWGLEAKYEKTSLYFSGTFDANRVRAVRVRQMLGRFTWLFFCVITPAGFLLFAKHLYEASLTQNYLFFADKNFSNFLFALALYGALYLWSESRRQKFLHEESNLGFLEKDNPKASLDVFAFFNSKTKDIWNSVTTLAQKEKQEPNLGTVVQALCHDSQIQTALGRLRVPNEFFLNEVKNFNSQTQEERICLKQLPYNALVTAVRLHSKSISSLILFYTLLKTLPQASALWKFCRQLSLSESQAEALCTWHVGLENINAEIQSIAAFSKYKALDVNRGLTSVPTPYLNQFSVDLTAMAKYRYLPLAYGRQKDLEEIFKLFSENIRCIVVKGAEGTGRSTLLNELAYHMVAEDVPGLMEDKRLIRLEISSIIGSNVSPETALHNALMEAEHNDNIILAVEEIHTLAKAQGAHGLNLLQVLVNFLEESSLMVIATTTPSEFLEYLEGITNFKQLFHTYELAPLEEKALIQSVCVKVSMLEAQYDIFFTYDAIAAATKYTSEFFGQQGQPQAAISLLTEVASKSGKGTTKFITQEDIQQAVSAKSHVPTTLNSDDSEKLLHLEDELSTQVVGQKSAVVAVANALRRSRSGLARGGKPIGSFLFVGPTGVGKTELAKSLARIYFGGENFFMRLDMSEYQASDGLQKLLGGQQSADTPFVEHIKEYPYCLLLLDEFEKADKQVLNLFLQIFDDGRITTSRGETLSLKNTIIIATSNAGTADIQKKLREGLDLERIRGQLISDILLKFFSPELLNRFDDIILFTSLSLDEINQVVALFLTGLAAQIKQNKDIDFSFTSQSVELIAKAGYDPAFGARPIRRFIQDHVDTLLAEFILKNNPSPGTKISLDAQDGKLVLN